MWAGQTGDDRMTGMDTDPDFGLDTVSIPEFMFDPGDGFGEAKP